MTDSPSVPVGFPSTLWSLVRDAGAPGREALDRLFSRYWKPVYWYVRVAAQRDATEALDLTQSFFLHAFETGFLGKADASRGRFRTFLRASLANFLVDQVRHDRRIRRGGEAVHLSIDRADLESADLLAAGKEFGPDTVFDREWCAAVVHRASEETKRRCAERGTPLYFEVFRLHDLEGGGAVPYRDLAARIQRSEDDVRNYLRAARAIFRDCIRDEIRETVGSAEDLPGELDELFAWLK